MNDIAKMRVALEKKYNKAFVTGKTDNQILAIYRRLQAKNQI